MNVKNKIPKTVKLKTYVITVLLFSMIFAGALNYTLSIPYVGDVTEVWVQPPFHEASYVVGVYNNTFYYGQNGTTGEYEWLSTNDDTVLQNAINTANSSGGGSVYVKAGSYSASVTVKQNVLLVLEAAVSGVGYTVDSGGYCIRYSDGYAWFDQPLNMTGHEIKFGAFHTGTSAPANPNTGQWWYDTNTYNLKIYNGTAWATVQGAQGPAGTLEGEQPYSYLVFTNSTGYYAINGTTGEIEFSHASNSSYVIQSALTTVRLNEGGLVFLKGGIYPLSVCLYIGANTTLQGESRDSVILIGCRPPNLGTWEAPILNYGWGTSAAENVVVRDLTINANQTGLSFGYRGIHFRPAIRDTVINVKVYDVAGWGVSFYGLDAAAGTPHDCLISDSEIWNCGYDCIEFTGYTEHEFYNGIATRNTVSKADGGVSTYNARDIVITANHFIDVDGAGLGATNHIGVPIQGTSHHITVMGNTFDHIDPISHFHGVSMLHTSTNCTISNNVINFWSSVSHGRPICPRYSIVKNNIIFRKASSGTWGVVIHDENLIEGNHFSGDANTALLYIENGDNNAVLGNIFYNTASGYGGLMIDSDSTSNIIEHNQFIDSDHTHTPLGIRCDGDNNIIRSNNFVNIDTGISVQGTADLTKIYENIFNTVTTSITNSGTNTDIKRNVGYVTENSGSQTVANNENIAHGLVTTPVYYSVTCLNETYDGEPVMVWLDYSGITSTNLNVCVYWFNGTAITDDCIYVAWEARTWN